MADANPSRPVDEKALLAQALQDNGKAEGIKNPEKLQPFVEVNSKTRMKEPGQVTRSIISGNIITTR